MGEHTDKTRQTPGEVSGKGKKVYAKAQLKQIDIQLGVFGCYGGDALRPNLPMNPWRNENGLDLRD